MKLEDIENYQNLRDKADGARMRLSSELEILWNEYKEYGSKYLDEFPYYVEDISTFDGVVTISGENYNTEGVSCSMPQEFVYGNAEARQNILANISAKSNEIKQNQREHEIEQLRKRLKQLEND